MLTRSLRTFSRSPLRIKPRTVLQQTFTNTRIALAVRSMCTDGERPRGAGQKRDMTQPAIWGMTAVVLTFALSYLAVPLYKLLCNETGDSLTRQDEAIEKLEGLRPPKNREARVITVNFCSEVNEKLQWGFKPCQRAIKVIPGKSSLAFFNAHNKTEKAVVGVATYNVTPTAAGVYFNKIQCFCFEEQRLKAREDIDMPVFFYLDPDLYEDPRMDGVRHITLSYTFFEASDAESIEESVNSGNTISIKDAGKYLPQGAEKYYPKVAQSPYTGEVGEGAKASGTPIA